MPSAFPKILQLGDRNLHDLYEEEVEITEKLDGSQFGFGLVDGELVCRSRGQIQDITSPDKLFKPAIDYVVSVQNRLPADVFFYGETFAGPRHSTLKYDRVPKNHIALFGAFLADGTAVRYPGIADWAFHLDVDVTPLLYYGKSSIDHTQTLLGQESYLGGQKIEGVVVKRYVDWLFLGQFIVPVKAGKLVSKEFKEVHTRDWAKLNKPNHLDNLKLSLRTEARWTKAVHHLRDDGLLTESVQDIGALFKEVHRDITEEEGENIKDALWEIYRKEILKAATGGLAEWYKEWLLGNTA